MPTEPGEVIRVTRQAQGLTLRQLADLAGVDYAYLSRVERGEKRPSGRWLRSVTDALGRHLAGAA